MLWFDPVAARHGSPVVPADVAKRTARMAGITIHAAVLCWTLYFTGKSFMRSFLLQREKNKQSSSFVERIWTVVSQVREFLPPTGGSVARRARRGTARGRR